MKIKVIGSGSMWTAFNSASYMIDDDILVDIPNGLCKNLFRMHIDSRNIENVLITHFHGDHYFDMPFFFLLKSKSDNKKINIYCDKSGKLKNYRLLKLAFPKPAKEVYNTINLKYNFKDNFNIYDYQVARYLVLHGRMKPAYGYVFSKENYKVGFTGDTTLCDSVEKMASICNYLFCDCMFITGTSKHMGIDNLKYLSEKYPNCHFVVSHLDDSAREELNKINIVNLTVPIDGQEFNIN